MPLQFYCGVTPSTLGATGIVKLKCYGSELREAKYDCHPSANRKIVDHKLLFCSYLI